MIGSGQGEFCSDDLVGRLGSMSTRKCDSDSWRETSLLTLRFELPEAARILRMSRAQLYNRIGEGLLRAQKDGARTYIKRAELERYVEACDSNCVPGPRATLTRPLTGRRYSE